MANQAFTPKQHSSQFAQDEEQQPRYNFGTDQITAATWQYLEREISVDQFAESIDNLGDFVDLLADTK